nr:MAG TPA: hypothetical protein [Bacteriophage sp.]
MLSRFLTRKSPDCYINQFGTCAYLIKMRTAAYWALRVYVSQPYK